MKAWHTPPLLRGCETKDKWASILLVECGRIDPKSMRKQERETRELAWKSFILGIPD
jgi:translation elongation factor EF-1alpha